MNLFEFFLKWPFARHGFGPHFEIASKAVYRMLESSWPIIFEEKVSHPGSSVAYKRCVEQRCPRWAENSTGYKANDACSPKNMESSASTVAVFTQVVWIKSIKGTACYFWKVGKLAVEGICDHDKIVTNPGRIFAATTVF